MRSLPTSTERVRTSLSSTRCHTIPPRSPGRSLSRRRDHQTHHTVSLRGPMAPLPLRTHGHPHTTPVRREHHQPPTPPSKVLRHIDDNLFRRDNVPHRTILRSATRRLKSTIAGAASVPRIRGARRVRRARIAHIPRSGDTRSSGRKQERERRGI
jgi:hypothetical protein